jgi:hypothetical protein
MIPTGGVFSTSYYQERQYGGIKWGRVGTNGNIKRWV